MTWIMWLSITFSYYSFFVWIPGLLVESGMSMTKSFGYSLAIYCAQVPGYFSAAWFNEKIGRQATIASYMLLAARARWGWRWPDGRPDHAGRHHHVILHERHLRRRLCLHRRGLSDGGAHHRRGLASAIGRLGAIASPVLVGYLYPKFGFLGVFGTTTVTLVLGALVVLVMGVPTRGRSLEAIAAERRNERRASFRPAVAVPALNAVARAHEAPSQPQAVFAAVDHALAGEIGHRLFTILS